MMLAQYAVSTTDQRQINDREHDTMYGLIMVFSAVVVIGLITALPFVLFF
jgi:hypothetical protein